MFNELTNFISKHLVDDEMEDETIVKQGRTVNIGGIADDDSVDFVLNKKIAMCNSSSDFDSLQENDERLSEQNVIVQGILNVLEENDVNKELDDDCSIHNLKSVRYSETIVNSADFLHSTPNKDGIIELNGSLDQRLSNETYLVLEQTLSVHEHLISLLEEKESEWNEAFIGSLDDVCDSTVLVNNRQEQERRTRILTEMKDIIAEGRRSISYSLDRSKGFRDQLQHYKINSPRLTTESFEKLTTITSEMYNLMTPISPDLFSTPKRSLRSRGPVEEYPYVLTKPLEYRRINKN